MIFNSGKREAVTTILNDLININNDRISVYENAITPSKNVDVELIELLQDIISDAKSYKQQLVEKIQSLGFQKPVQASVSGKIHKAWLDLVMGFTKFTYTRNTLISSCQYNEEVALHAYMAALSLASDMNREVRELITRQYESLKIKYDRIKKHREDYHLINSGLTYIY